jgi:cytochrome P450
MSDTPDVYQLSALLNPDMDQEHPQAWYLEQARKPPELGEGIFGGPSASITRMADVLAVNMHKGVLAKPPGSPPTMGGIRPLIPLDLDGADQAKYRKLLDPLFAPKHVAALEPRIRDLTDQLVDTFIEDGRVELYHAFCQPLPGTIFISLLGLPLDEIDTFIRFKDYAIRAPGDTPEEQAVNRDQAGRDMADRLYRELDDRRKNGQPADDLIAGFMQADVDGHRLSDDDIVDICYLLVIAGLDTVAASLSCIIHWLAQHPDEQRRLRAHPEELPQAIEELMRFESPVIGGGRYAAEDIEINGTTIPAGTMLAVSWSAANMDPEVFDDPLTVDLHRPTNRHIGFASGYHRCLGSHLARLELRAAIQRFHERVEHYWIADGEAAKVHNLGVRTFEHLPLGFDRA